MKVENAQVDVECIHALGQRNFWSQSKISNKSWIPFFSPLSCLSVFWSLCGHMKESARSFINTPLQIEGFTKILCFTTSFAYFVVVILCVHGNMNSGTLICTFQVRSKFALSTHSLTCIYYTALASAPSHQVFAGLCLVEGAMRSKINIPIFHLVL